jgi:hypothetical protein
MLTYIKPCYKYTKNLFDRMWQLSLLNHKTNKNVIYLSFV